MDSIKGMISFSPCLEGLPSIDIPYNCSSGLPIAKAIPGECSPSVNISLLTDDYQNFTEGQKALLEFCTIFGHLEIKQVQYIIRQFPFIQLKFSAAAKCELPVCDICEFSKARCHTKQTVNITKRITHDGSLKMEIYTLVPQFMLIILN